ncbi:MAG TPA: putative metal-dependent hydrolase [Gemmatimonadales bacterium]|nr:putative metal-dependent hydrolase [Gemmatimonadales bacterium]
MTDLRYPIGPFTFDGDTSANARSRRIAQIAALPEALGAAVAGLSERQLDTPYRPGGWTVRQVVHHVPDSHLNAYTRFKLALTEENPTIRPYHEARWAELQDTRATPIAVSLLLLSALHERWVNLLSSMDDDDWRRPMVHPDSGQLDLDQMLAQYGWHGAHHVAHVTALRAREDWD